MTTKLPDQLAQADWNDLYRRLVAFVKNRLGTRGSMDDVEEIAQEAIRRCFDPEYATWDQAKYPDLSEFLGSIANGLIQNLTKKKSTTEETPEPPQSVAFATAHTSEAMTPEAQVADRELLERAFSMISERIDGRPLVEDVFLAGFADGIVKAAEQAEKLGRPVSQVYEARRELARHLAEVKQLIDHEVSNGS